MKIPFWILQFFFAFLFSGWGAVIVGLYIAKMLLLRFCTSLKIRVLGFLVVASFCTLITYILAWSDWHNPQKSSALAIWVGAPLLALCVPIISFAIDQLRSRYRSRRYIRWIVEIVLICPLWAAIFETLEIMLGWYWI
jgi:hypothetical protein